MADQKWLCLVLGTVLILGFSSQTQSADSTKPVCKSPTDIVLMLDQSGSMKEGERVAVVKKAAQEIVKTLALPTGSSDKPIYRVGVYMYSGAAEQKIVQQMIDLKDKKTVDDVVKKIGEANVHHGQTHTDTALKNVREKMLPKGRSDVPNTVVMIADGQIFKGDSADVKKKAVESLFAEADKMKKEARIFAMGIGEKLAEFREQLKKVATQPSSANYYEVSDWKKVEKEVPSVISATLTCPPAAECKKP
ncbi:von Willebrand factor A domain-containing protein 2-like [Tubulanus polymorphus]|uniref:von Willebrand factor A domain-containing protein 2-like n=1 Tax=Tubulanus polymorphus TaxID=672921 RepID=UPI003DA6AF41